MIDLSEASLLAFFSEFAYEPFQVYGLVILFMIASSFGFPIPEELVLVSAGLVAYMAHDTVNFPPPYPGATGVNTYILAFVCFGAVFLSDLLVFFIGKFFGAKFIKTEFFKKRVHGAAFDKVNLWFAKYGSLACGIFRFTPGLRLPGHMSCGFLGIPIWKFVLIDGFAALISVPTQIILVATYGSIVLDNMKTVKLAFLAILLIAVTAYFIKRAKRPV